MLSPIDLQNKKIVTKKRKYDKAEMDEYLDLVFENYKDLYNQNQELQKQVKTLSDGVQYYHSIESTMQKALVLAEQTSKETKDAAVLKAEAIEKDANARAAKIVSKAEQEYETIKDKCLYLVQQFNQYKMQLKQVATAQLELITSDSFDVYSPELEAIQNARNALPGEAEGTVINPVTATVPEPVKPDTVVPEKPENAPAVQKLQKTENTVAGTMDSVPAPEDDLMNMLSPVEDLEDTMSQLSDTTINETNVIEKTTVLPDLKTELDKGGKKYPDKDTMSILTADTIDLRTPMEKAQEKEPKKAPVPKKAAPETVIPKTVVPPNAVPKSVETKRAETKSTEVKSTKAESAEQKSTKPESTDLESMGLESMDLESVEPGALEPETLEPIPEDKGGPTLDSLLQNMNLGRKKKKKGQEEDPFEFLGSVDDF